MNLEQFLNDCRQQIEAATEKHCIIQLIDKIDLVLPLITMDELFNTIQDLNTGKKEIKHFCLLAARAGHSAVKISKHLNKSDHTAVLYHLKTGEDLLRKNKAFLLQHNKAIDTIEQLFIGRTLQQAV